MRASRLLSLLLLLQTRGRMTAAELSEELEVSIRTVYRDVEALSSAGVPVYADRGPAGGYRLLDGYRTRLNGLTAEEASSMFLAALPGPAAELGLGEVAAAAELKLLAALPPGPRSHATRMRERFHLDVPGWYRSAEEAPFLGEVARAVWEQRPVRMTYRRWGPQDVERLVHPYGLVLKGGSWYMVASPGEESPRTYKVARIVAAEVLDGCFERPEGFDLADFWARYTVDFRERMYTAHALIRLAPGLEGLLRYTVGEDPADAALACAGPPDERGWRVLRLPVESIRHARWLLLRLGTDVEVLEPPELRAAMAETAAALTVLYGLPPAGGPAHAEG
ncbi:transcriptional regulator [Planomonospora parontospora subsp. parontospora]|uniref:Transcriptional regulator n=2 Tax=Planomonospora parontospora TaxID=58119 RepID=A0AA37BIS7_9ACTN|nr:WYL domain-containing protein [Planomonospora parontospora]GGK77443.1 transcriptional regulator [Planomonospora parontospora]GII10003.1 transcriptional regulator [Planomonospora parontospora subsp. parontospora]